MFSVRHAVSFRSRSGGALQEAQGGALVSLLSVILQDAGRGGRTHPRAPPAWTSPLCRQQCGAVCWEYVKCACVRGDKQAVICVACGRDTSSQFTWWWVTANTADVDVDSNSNSGFRVAFEFSTDAASLPMSPLLQGVRPEVQFDATRAHPQRG